MQDRHAGPGERGKIVDVRHFCVFVRLSLGDHGAAQDGILAVDARNLVRVFDGPGVVLPGTRADAFQGRFFGEACAGHELVRGDVNGVLGVSC